MRRDKSRTVSTIKELYNGLGGRSAEITTTPKTRQPIGEKDYDHVTDVTTQDQGQ
jgi:hypothetical protein